MKESIGEGGFNKFERDENGNLRPNISELKKKREEYVYEAIEKMKKEIPQDMFNIENIEYLTSALIGILEREHKEVDLNILIREGDDFKTKRKVNQATEFLDTYPEKWLKEILIKHLEANS